MFKILTPFLLTFTALPLVFRYYLKKEYEKRLTEVINEEDTSYCECLFFGYRNFKCADHVKNRQECSDHCSLTRLKRIEHFIGSAKRSIDVCMYIFTLKEISAQLIKASQRGVVVRVITDMEMAKNASAQALWENLKDFGILCKTPPSSNELMHHKFCIIDAKNTESAKALYGSLNFTKQAFCHNFESVILTNNKHIIRRLSEEFEELWKLFNIYL